MNLQIRLNNEEIAQELAARGELLLSAILRAVGTLGTQLLERVRSKILPVVRTEIGQEFLDSIQLQAAAYVDQVCKTSVGIDDEGQPSYIVAYVREFGGEKWYDIFPVNAKALAFMGGVFNPESLSNAKTVQTMVFTKHVYHPPAIERSYLRSSLAEMQEAVQAELTRTIAEVLAA